MSGPTKETKDVREILESKKWTMLSKEYTGHLQKIHISCPLGHNQTKRLKDIVSNQKCMKCHYISGVAGKPTHQFSAVKEYVESFEYVLISDTYRRQSDLLDMKCLNNHRCSISFKKFKQGRRCRHCDVSRKKEYGEVKSFIESVGFQLLDEEYSPASKLRIKCKNDHVMDKQWSQFYRRPVCGECSSPYKNMSRTEYRLMYGRSDIGIYNRYRNDCNRRGRLVRGITMELSFDQFSELINKPCHYCGIVNCRGIDRVDSDGNYTVQNTHPCCKVCNEMKSNRTVNEFIAHIKKILINRGI